MIKYLRVPALNCSSKITTQVPRNTILFYFQVIIVLPDVLYLATTGTSELLYATKSSLKLHLKINYLYAIQLSVSNQLQVSEVTS